MPRERQELFRDSNVLQKERIIVLAFEGNKTEEAYFDSVKAFNRFNEDVIHLHILKRSKNDTKSAPKHVFNKLKREAKDEYNFDALDELWMIIDRDSWPNLPDIISLCKAQGNMYVAGSNPCFEFWLLLHIVRIEDISLDDRALLLTNAKISNEKNFIDRFLGNLLEGGYNKKRPRPERFLENVDAAVQSAKALNIADEDFPSDLGSHVYKIVEKILKPSLSSD